MPKATQLVNGSVGIKLSYRTAVYKFLMAVNCSRMVRKVVSIVYKFDIKLNACGAAVVPT